MIKPAVTIVVPCRNEIGHIESTVRSILAQQPPPGGCEVIVADGMSDDGTREILARIAREHTGIRVVDNLGGIVSTGLNAAIRDARGATIIRMDAHTRYAPDYVRRCVETLVETGADNVGGPWVAAGDGLLGRAVAAAFQSSFGMGGARGHNPGYEGIVDTVYLGCWRRDVFERIGGFDEDLVRNQDDELNFRLTRAGGRIWQSPLIRSWYIPRNSLGALFKQYMQYGYWKVRVLQKHGRPASLRHLVPAAFVAALGASALAGLMFPLLRQLALGLAVAYSTAALLASAWTAAGRGWKLFPVLPIVFACCHIGYGLGFLEGVLDFGLRRRTSGTRHAALTRTSAMPVAPPLTSGHRERI
jgi:glycosyltransferase involved in cell wall biosynthesis